MSVLSIRSLALGLCVAASAWAQTPALPAGHPPLGQNPAPANPTTLPSGHPAIPGMSPANALPTGHPPLAAPSTQPGATASVAIRAKQGTKDGPAIGEEPFTLELYHRQTLLKKIEGRLDKNGVAVVEGLPAQMPVIAVVRVVHAGANYEAVIEDLGPQKLSGQAEVTVYETTEQAPAWQVPMRHVMAQMTEEGLRVIEVLAVENPTDRAWIGKADANGKRQTLSLELPEGASELQFGGGLHDCCVQTADGRLVNTMPLTPGVNEMQFLYLLPVKEGKASMKMVAPAAVKRLVFVATDNGPQVSVEGLNFTGARQGRNMNVKILSYEGTDLAAGHVAKVNFTMPAGMARAGGQDEPSSSMLPKIIAGVGGFLILAIGAVIILLKPKKAAVK